MAINITSIMTPEQILEIAHKATALPSIIILYIVMSLTFLLVGLFSIDGSRGNNPYSKFMWIWSISIFISGLVVIWISVSPNTIQSIVETLNSMIS